jgi:hypothetical protein
LLRCSGPWVIALAQRPTVGPARSILEKMYQKDVESVGVKKQHSIYPLLYLSFVIFSKKLYPLYSSQASSFISRPLYINTYISEREMCPWAISKYFGD